jgi:hypothetical protein
VQPSLVLAHTPRTGLHDAETSKERALSREASAQLPCSPNSHSDRLCTTANAKNANPTCRDMPFVIHAAAHQ